MLYAIALELLYIFHVCYLCCVMLVCCLFYVYIIIVVRISNFMHIIIDDENDVANDGDDHDTIYVDDCDGGYDKDTLL